MALPMPDPPERRATLPWYCPQCGTPFLPEGMVRPVYIVAFVPQSRWSLIWHTAADRRDHLDMWLTECPDCGGTVYLLNALNPLLLDYRRRKEIVTYAEVAGIGFNALLLCAFPGGIPFVLLAVLLFCAVVCFTAPKAPWWAS